MKTVEEIKQLIEKRNAEARKDHERRYGKPLPEEPEQARFRRLYNNDAAWEQM